jgi:hypothetical protein
MRQNYWAHSYPAVGVGAVLSSIAGLIDGAFGVTAARRQAVRERMAPVDDYLLLTLELCKELADIFGTWGPAAVMTADVRLRASRAINNEMVDRLAIPGLRARDAAESIDADLTRRLDDADRVKLAIIGLFNTTLVGQPLTPLIRHLAEIRMMNARVAERIRQLQA